MTTRPDGNATYQRLLEVAGQLFGEQGFHRTTVKAICDAAEANIAAVNYHFGDKVGLYVAVWAAAYDREVNAHPFAVLGDTSPEAQLRVHIQSLVRRTAGLDPGGVLEKLRSQERLRPTKLIDAAFQTIRRPAREHLRSTIAQLLGVALTDPQVDWCEASIIAQTRAINPTIQKTIEALQDRSGDADFVDRYAEHVTAFSLAALKSLSQQQ